MSFTERVARAQWWCLLITPIITVPLELRADRVTSADQAVLSWFVLMACLAFGLVCALILLVRAILDFGRPSTQRVLMVALALALVPCAFICFDVEKSMGWPTGGNSTFEVTRASLAVGLWTVIVLLSRSPIRSIQ